ncbi:MAG: hypothetical protein WD648_03665 [Planctomycetaceae bacterium]
MHEDHKLKEGWYFLSEMHAKLRDPHAFVHCLSAFLSAARSAAQYALKEAKTKPNGQAWYDGAVQATKRPLMSFFREERDVNVHVKPVAPKAIFQVEANVTLHIRGSADYRVRFVDDKGQPVEIASPPPVPAPASPPVSSPREREIRYEFADRPGEDALQLCEHYLKELESFVKEGQNAGFVTP